MGAFVVSLIFVGFVVLAGFAIRQFTVALSDRAREQRERREDMERSAQQRDDRIRSMSQNELSRAFTSREITPDEYLRYGQRHATNRIVYRSPMTDR